MSHPMHGQSTELFMSELYCNSPGVSIEFHIISLHTDHKIEFQNKWQSTKGAYPIHMQSFNIQLT